MVDEFMINLKLTIENHAINHDNIFQLFDSPNNH